MTTATLDPLLVPTVMFQGKWSLGRSLDVYWLFSTIIHSYVSRCLDEFDLGLDDIAMDNEANNKAMRLTFGSIFKTYPLILSQLLLFLANIVITSCFCRSRL